MLNKPTNQKDLFKVPENYFENFNTQIMAQLPDKKIIRVVPLWKKVLPWTAVAAAICGIVFSVGIFNSGDDTVAQKMNGVENSGNEKSMASTTAPVSGVDEDEYFQYLKEEATMSSYRDMVYNDY